MPDDLRQLYLVLGGGFPTPMGGKTAPIKHFYRRQYQITGGDWRTIYYAFFMDWKGKRRRYPFGFRGQITEDQLSDIYLL